MKLHSLSQGFCQQSAESKPPKKYLISYFVSMSDQGLETQLMLLLHLKKDLLFGNRMINNWLLMTNYQVIVYDKHYKIRGRTSTPNLILDNHLLVNRLFDKLLLDGRIFDNLLRLLISSFVAMIF